jgi:flagellar motility protein MotE (MotC chaperone)
MKIKILLTVVILNIICLGIYLVIRPANLEAETKKAPQKQVQAAQPQAPVSMEPGGQIDMLRQREEQVKAREMELRELERQVTEKIKKLEAIEASLKIELEAYKVVAGERVKQLVKIYSSMKPKAAATLMNNLDQDVAVQVILGMKGEIAGAILAGMDPPKAAAISQKLMYFRTGIGAPSIAPAAPASAPAAEKAPAEQKTSEMEPPAAAPAVSYQDEKPPVVAKAPAAKSRAAAKKSVIAKVSAQPKQTIATVAKPAPAQAAASAPSVVSAPASASAPVAAFAPVPASMPVPVSTPAPVPAAPASQAAPAPAPEPAHALAVGESPAE